MNHKIIFSGEAISLNQTADAVMKDMQTAIDKYFPSPNNFVQVSNYKELDVHSFEIDIVRQYADNSGITYGNCVCDQDESLITGLDISAFQPVKQGKALIVPILPGNDNMFYSPVKNFEDLWKQQNEVMINETIKNISIIPMRDRINIKVKYDNGKGKKSKKSGKKI